MSRSCYHRLALRTEKEQLPEPHSFLTGGLSTSLTYNLVSIWSIAASFWRVYLKIILSYFYVLMASVATEGKIQTSRLDFQSTLTLVSS